MPDDVTALRDRIVEAAARAHYEAVNLRVHGNVWPTWDALPEQHREWFRADQRAALAAAVREAGLDAERLGAACRVLDERVKWRRAYEAARHVGDLDIAATDCLERTAYLLRALAGIGDG